MVRVTDLMADQVGLRLAPLALCSVSLTQAKKAQQPAVHVSYFLFDDYILLFMD